MLADYYYSNNISIKHKNINIILLFVGNWLAVIIIMHYKLYTRLKL